MVMYLLGTHHHCPGAEPAEAGVPREAIRGEVMTVEGEATTTITIRGRLRTLDASTSNALSPRTSLSKI